MPNKLRSIIANDAGGRIIDDKSYPISIKIETVLDVSASDRSTQSVVRAICDGVVVGSEVRSSGGSFPGPVFTATYGEDRLNKHRVAVQDLPGSFQRRIKDQRMTGYMKMQNITPHAIP